MLAYVTLAASTVIEARAVQKLNAEPPMIVTLAGSSILVRAMQELNAEVAIPVTVAGMVTAPLLPEGH
jgi:small ligand-binding sensory domain FIST